MNRRRFLTTIPVTLLVSGCTGGESGGGSTPTVTHPSADAAVAIANTAFQQVRVSVDGGATVAWVNEDDVVHSVSSARFHDAASEWRFDERVPPDSSVTHGFDEGGVYEYRCTIHGAETMCGAVLVGGSSLDEPLPCVGGEGEGGGGGGGYYRISPSSARVGSPRR